MRLQEVLGNASSIFDQAGDHAGQCKPHWAKPDGFYLMIGLAFIYMAAGYGSIPTGP